MKFGVRYCYIFALLVCLFLTNGRVYSDVPSSSTNGVPLAGSLEEDRDLLQTLDELLEQANRDRDVAEDYLKEHVDQERKTRADAVNLFSKFEKSEQKQLANDLKEGELSEAFRDRVDAQNLWFALQRLEIEQGRVEKIRTFHKELSDKISEAETVRNRIRHMFSDAQDDNLREEEKFVVEFSKFLDDAHKKLETWKKNDRRSSGDIVDLLVKDSEDQIEETQRRENASEGKEFVSNNGWSRVDVEKREEREFGEQEDLDADNLLEQGSEQLNVDVNILLEQEDGVGNLIEQAMESEKGAEEESTAPQVEFNGEQDVKNEENVEKKLKGQEVEEEESVQEEGQWTEVKQATNLKDAVSTRPEKITTETNLRPAAKPKTLSTKERSRERQTFSVQNVEFAFRLCPGSDSKSDGEFWIQETEITQEQWFALGMRTTRPCGFNGARLPVENVDLNACVAFVQRLNAYNVAPEGWSFSIPTEAQWELAWQAGGNGTKTASLGERAWFGENSDNKTHEVGTRKPDALGLYDMSGNVWEWTRSTDGTGRAWIVCGASWNNLPQNGTLVNRFACNAKTCGNNLGLRLVLVRKQ